MRWLLSGLLIFWFVALPDAALAQRPSGKNKDKPATTNKASAGRLKLRVTLEGHKDKVNAVAFSPDGKLLASASDDTTIKIWDTQTGKELRTLIPNKKSVDWVVFSPDAKWLASATFVSVLNKIENAVMIWDVATWEPKVQLEDNKGSYRCVAFSPDSKTLAAADASLVKLWDTSTGKKIGMLYENAAEVYQVFSVAFSPDGKYLVLGASSPDTPIDPIRVWDWKENKRTATLKAESGNAFLDRTCFRVAFMKDGKTLLTQAGKITLWDFEKLKPIKKFGPKEYSPAFATEPSALSPDDKILATLGPRFTLWSVAKGEPLETIADDDRASCLAFSPQGGMLAVGFEPKDKTPTRGKARTPARGSGGAIIKIWDIRDSAR
jgi:WD40 repeat protein